jgi:cyclase
MATHSTLIVGRMKGPESAEGAAKLFDAFDQTDMPYLMGTRRRELFTYRGLYIHMQDFDVEHAGSRIEGARTDPRFIQISADLKAYLAAYDPETWRSPADAMATRFYHWEASD